MKPELSKIKTIVVVMMENRSFDHMLGYLSLPPFNRTDVDGQSTDPAWLARYTNSEPDQSVQPFHSTNPYTLPTEFDPPHERSNIADQIGTIQNGVYPMNGFVNAIPNSISFDPKVRRLVMSYFGAEEAPMNDFLATNFTICDNWFCSLPAGTQANRLMSMSGISMIDTNVHLLPRQDLVYDWLTAHKVSWRVYHQGIPFFTLMLKWIPDILFDSDHFRSFNDDFEKDLEETPPDQLPQVIFIEPTYGDGPHIGFSTDEHAPAGISDGQEFLMRIYTVVIDPSIWENVLLIVDYDEHGGFFDHVTPPLITTDPPSGANYPQFKSLGVRVPAYVISPFVQRGDVSHILLDHTSVLKLFGEKFDSAGSYSPVVDARPVKSVSEILRFDNPILNPPPAPALDGYLAKRPPAPIVTVPELKTPLQIAFSDALVNLRQQGAGPDHPKFGELIQKVDAHASGTAPLLS